MKVKKFCAPTSREALRLVRESLGGDAIILSNRQTAAGIEIMAVAEQEVTAATDSAEESSTAFRPNRPEMNRMAYSVNPPAFQPEQPLSPPQNHYDSSAEIVREMRYLRSLLQGQLSGFAWGEMGRSEPIRVELMKAMLGAGFSAGLARELTTHLPEGCDLAKAFSWLKAAFVHNMQVAKEGQDLIFQGGVYALVGPTGVGKTTTVAKLAARCALAHGPSHIALLTTDNYRIGAHEQLRIYGKILGVPVHPVSDVTDLQATLQDLRLKHLVLIDTVGMSQRDVRLVEQIELLSGQARKVHRILLLNAAAQADMLEDVVGIYTRAGVDGCIITKVDEALSLGGILDVLIRYRLCLHFMTNGQRVPEDLHSIQAAYLVDRTFRLRPHPLFAMQDAEFPIAMAAKDSSVNQEAGV
ncbi:MAG: flagellar biosynthesis protein FlhF [Proteobacteria bacterium]|nr:flagellar biosynthesis protein FlhF [Pseudomonadota bacterium]MDE3207393.1 flagellar biosynthesis protein FlhF [Pseudomonadota bacterium]